MPTAPSGARISQGPSRVPGANAILAAIIPSVGFVGYVQPSERPYQGLPEAQEFQLPSSRRSTNWALAVRWFAKSACLEVEQLLRVSAANLQTVSFAQRSMVEPLSGDTHVLERKVNRVQDAIGADLIDYFCQGLCSKISTRGDIKILP